MSAPPRVVLGMPAFNRPDAIRRALESLLTQTYREFALVVVDDSPASGAAAIVAEYTAEDSRLTYEANPARLGMIGNWRHAFARARALHPHAEFFAWVSDHDVWHPHWLQELVGLLDREPDVVVAYPQSLRMLDDDARIVDRGFDSGGLASPSRRLRAAASRMLAGDLIYGLMRADALAAAGVFRPVVTPDRQVLLALSLLGPFRQVREVLWYREFVRFGLERQRHTLFPSAAPLYTRLPSHVQHSAMLFLDFAVRGRGRPAIGRVAALRHVMMQLYWSTVRQMRQRRAA